MLDRTFLQIQTFLGGKATLSRLVAILEMMHL
jgi:hypothetical protein